MLGFRVGVCALEFRVLGFEVQGLGLRANAVENDCRGLLGLELTRHRQLLKLSVPESQALPCAMPGGTYYEDCTSLSRA